MDSMIDSRNELDEKMGEFIDLAAHDLDAPLRKLSVMVDSMQRKYELGEKEEATLYVPRIQKCLGDMRSLINSIVAYSRAGFKSKAAEEFSLTGLVQEILDAFKDMILQENAKVDVGNLPRVVGIREQLATVIRHLISNALLYNRDVQPSLKIYEGKITGEEKEAAGLAGGKEYVKIIFEDNGLGIPDGFNEKIFQPFVRLNGKSEFAGNGIGLAMSKRIMKNLEGVIYAEKRDGAGARFIIIIPQTS